jgi:hypothetical protein
MNKKIAAVFIISWSWMSLFCLVAADDPRIFGFPVSEGLGVFVSGSGKGLSFSHPGQNFPGTTSWLIAYPELGQGAVIMANGARGDMLTLEIIAALAAAYGWPSMQ